MLAVVTFTFNAYDDVWIGSLSRIEEYTSSSYIMLVFMVAAAAAADLPNCEFTVKRDHVSHRHCHTQLQYSTVLYCTGGGWRLAARGAAWLSDYVCEHAARTSQHR
jgi:hypothetical protein